MKKIEKNILHEVQFTSTLCNGKACGSNDAVRTEFSRTTNQKPPRLEVWNPRWTQTTWRTVQCLTGLSLLGFENPLEALLPKTRTKECRDPLRAALTTRGRQEGPHF